MTQKAPVQAEIKPFRIDVPQSDIDDLKRRLAATRWPDEIPGYGFPLSQARELVDYWRTGYDWRKQEARLNELPQFTTEIDGQNVHFIHVRSKRADALPLLMVHGWPGSIVEFMNVIEPLSKNFHVVVPSIPGYGFSGPTHEAGWDVKRVAAAFAELMSRLGYERYGTQGGDWGSAITRQLGLIDSEHVVGSHFNTLGVAPSGDPEEMKQLTDREKSFLERAQRFQRQGSGYFMIQASRPQTIAYALTDSPAGLLAWIAEKFTEWSDPESAIDRDQLLTNVSVYWFTGTANSSARLYAEFARSGATWGKVDRSTVPAGIAQMPHEIVPPIRRFAERDNNVVHWTEFEHGGHFAAMEQPELLVADIEKFFGGLR